MNTTYIRRSLDAMEQHLKAGEIEKAKGEALFIQDQLYQVLIMEPEPANADEFELNNNGKPY